MKSILFVFLLFASVNWLYSQNSIKLSGYVVEQNSGYNTGEVRLLRDVFIEHSGKLLTTSNKKGVFTLEFPIELEGVSIRINARKDGYLIVNEIDLLHLRLEKENLPVVIIMNRSEQLEQLISKHQKAILNTALNSYHDQLATLKSDSVKAPRLIKALETEFGKKAGSTQRAQELLKIYYEDIQLHSLKVAKRLSLVNLDDQNETYITAVDYFLKGAFDKAFATLKDAGIEEKLHGYHGQPGEAAFAPPEELNLCVLKAHFHSLNFEFKQARELFEIASALDPYENLFIFHSVLSSRMNTSFESTKTRLEQNILEYKDLVAADPELYKSHLVVNLVNLGILLKSDHQFDAAIKRLEEALEISRTLAEQNQAAHLVQLLGVLHNLGAFHNANGDKTVAMTYYQEALSVAEKLSGFRLQNIQWQSAHYYDIMAEFFLEHHHLDLAEKYFKQALDSYRNLTQNGEAFFKDKIVECLNNLGSLYLKKGSYEKSFSSYLESLALLKSLSSQTPETYLPKLALVFNRLGSVLQKKGDYETAKHYFKQSSSIFEDLALRNPEGYQFELALSFYLTGFLSSKTGENDEARGYLTKAADLFKELIETHTEMVNPEMRLTFFQLGIIEFHLGNYESALEHLMKSENLSRQMAKSDSTDIHDQLSLNLYYLSETLVAQNKHEKARPYLLEAISLKKELVTKSPKEHERLYANMLMSLGIIQDFMGEVSNSELNYKKALAIQSRLASSDPSKYNLDLCATKINLGILYMSRLKETNDKKYTESIKEIIEDCRLLLSIYPSGSTEAEAFRSKIKELEAFVELAPALHIPPSEIKEMMDRMEDIFYALEGSLNAIEEANYIKEALQIAIKLNEVMPGLEEDSGLIAELSGRLAWNNLGVFEFELAEKAARKGLKHNPQADWIKTHLAYALLYQGKFEDAKALYLSLKDKPYFRKNYDYRWGPVTTYKQVFNFELNSLTSRGIKPPDLAKWRALLKE